MADVTIIICTRNRAESLRQTLASLDSINVPIGLHPEILVVDNGSMDDTAEVIRKHPALRIPVGYVFERAPGQTRARNTGLSCCKGDIVIFTDDDLRFSKPWLETMCEPIVQEKADAVAGDVDLAPHLQRPWMTLLHRSWLASTERLDSVELSDMVGANMAFSRRVLDRVPSFDSELGPGALGFYDDTLFSYQLKKAGLRIRGCDGPAALHCFDKDRLSRAHWLRAAKNFGVSLAYVDYHWRHKSILPWTYHFRLYRSVARYYFNRILKGRDCVSTEGAPEWELWCVENIHRLAQYAVERKRPRNYDLEGLVKIHGNAKPTQGLASLKESSIIRAS